MYDARFKREDIVEHKFLIQIYNTTDKTFYQSSPEYTRENRLLFSAYDFIILYSSVDSSVFQS